MCGIAGAIRRTARRPPRPAAARSPWVAGVVERMSAAQRHRGPDGCGLWESSGAGGRLRPSAARHPGPERGRRPADDRRRLRLRHHLQRRDLQLRRAPPRPRGRRARRSAPRATRRSSSRRTSAGASRRCGRFRGIFALALWDPRARAVHLVRDPMGIKPLYWTVERDGETGEEVVLFASEVRALLASGAVPRRLDPAAVASYLWHGFVVGPHTIVEGVHLLPAATRPHPRGRPARGANARTTREYWRLPSSPRSADHGGRTCATSSGRHGHACSSSSDVPLGRLPVGRRSTRARWRRSPARSRPDGRAHLHHRLRRGRLRRDAARRSGWPTPSGAGTRTVRPHGAGASRSSCPTPSRPSTSRPSTASTPTS